MEFTAAAEGEFLPMGAGPVGRLLVGPGAAGGLAGGLAGGIIDGADGSCGAGLPTMFLSGKCDEFPEV
jgi:hypothetical protein